MPEKMNPIVKAFSADVSVSEGERAVTAKISTIAVDRDGEVLIPRGCNTKEFEANPIVCLAHNYYGLPVGKCVAIKREDDAIIAKTIFAERPKDYPAGEEWIPDTLFSLYQQGVLRGFSVGALPIEVRPATDADVKKFGAGVKRVYSKWKMFEYSVAPIPANQESLTLAVAKGMLSKTTAKGVFDFDPPERVALKYTIQSEISKTNKPDAVADAVRKSRGCLYVL